MPNGPFTMPMFRSLTPRKMQPWIYLLFAFLFQLSGGMYAGAMPHTMGDTCMMREDVLMIVLCGVVGVNMPFPFLFRFKFRFTNRTLLTVAAAGIAVCNLLCLTTESVPLLCAISYVAGFLKLCGTFECMSNIQLWMTPKRDFAIFFPLLYCVVLGNMSLSPWITVHLTYVFQSWHAMHLCMAAVMALVAMAVVVLTRDFRFMKPLPLVSLDWLGCLLWSALMIEVIFLFNYGEYYNWFDGQPMRMVAWTVPITLYFCVQRMRHIRHPYIAFEAWRYKGVVSLLGLFAVAELISATDKALQSPFTAALLHWGALQTAPLYMVEWAGTVAGCMFVMFWIKTLHQKYTRLLALGMASLLAYEVMMYLSVSPGIDLATLFAPTFMRTFGVAIFFTALTIYLEDVMPFQHFFMGLTMMGIVRNGVVETVCSGIYGHLLRHHTADNLVRSLPYDTLQAMLVGVKQLFGATCIIAVVALAVLLLWDLQPVRTTLRRMPSWAAVGRRLRMSMKR